MRHVLNDALHEIESLRRRNELLQAKVDVVEIFSAALLGKPGPVGMSPDVVWSLRKEIAKLAEPQPVSTE